MPSHSRPSHLQARGVVHLYESQPLLRSIKQQVEAQLGEG